MPRSTFGAASSSKVWAISSAVICRCVSAVDMGYSSSWSRRSGMVRQHQTRNLEILRCAIAHLRFGPADRSGMTTTSSLHRLNAFPVGLAVAEGLERDVLQHGVAELVLVDLGDGQALLLEEGDQLGLVLLDLRGRLGGCLLRHVGEDLLVLVAELLPERTGHHRVEVVDDVAGQH